MAISRKAILATLAGAVLLGGCAVGPYYDDYGYYGYDRYGYGYGYDYPYYYGPSYYGPSVGLGFTYSDRDYRRYHRDDRDRDWRRDRDGRDRDGRDRDGRDRDGWRDRPPQDPINRGGDLGTGRDPLRDPSYSPG